MTALCEIKLMENHAIFGGGLDIVVLTRHPVAPGCVPTGTAWTSPVSSPVNEGALLPTLGPRLSREGAQQLLDRLIELGFRPTSAVLDSQIERLGGLTERLENVIGAAEAALDLPTDAVKGMY